MLLILTQLISKKWISNCATFLKTRVPVNGLVVSASLSQILDLTSCNQPCASVYTHRESLTDSLLIFCRPVVSFQSSIKASSSLKMRRQSKQDQDQEWGENANHDDPTLSNKQQRGHRLHWWDPSLEGNFLCASAASVTASQSNKSKRWFCLYFWNCDSFFSSYQQLIPAIALPNLRGK